MINCLPDIIENNLANKGYRKTKSRKKLLQFITSRGNELFSIDDYKKYDTNFNVSSFYNNIHLFIDNDIISKRIDNDVTKYVIKSKNIIHSTCERCGSKWTEYMKDNSIIHINDIYSFELNIILKKCHNC